MKKLSIIVILMMISLGSKSQITMLGQPQYAVQQWLEKSKDFFTITAEGELTKDDGMYFYTFKLNEGTDVFRIRVNTKGVTDVFEVITNNQNLWQCSSELNKKYTKVSDNEWKYKTIRIDTSILDNGLLRIRYVYNSY